MKKTSLSEVTKRDLSSINYNETTKNRNEVHERLLNSFQGLQEQKSIELQLLGLQQLNEQYNINMVLQEQQIRELQQFQEQQIRDQQLMEQQIMEQQIMDQQQRDTQQLQEQQINQQMQEQQYQDQQMHANFNTFGNFDNQVDFGSSFEFGFNDFNMF